MKVAKVNFRSKRDLNRILKVLNIDLGNICNIMMIQKKIEESGKTNISFKY